MEIGYPRSMNLYKCSLRFSTLVLNWTIKYRNEIGEAEFLKIRKMVMQIPKNIASAIVDIHIKNKYKKLNHAKETFLLLTSSLRNLGMETSEKHLVVLSLELLKLINGYFGYLGKKKNAK